MKQITQVSVCVKNKSRSNIYLDGQFFCSLDNLIVIKYGLKEGVKIDEQKLAEIQEENEFSTALDKALTYITKYKKTRKQIIEYLMKKGYLYPLAHKVVQKLESYGFASDSDYASSYVRENSKNKGKLLLKMQLRAKGVDEKTAEQAIDEIKDETPSAIIVAQKYLKNKELTYENLGKCYRYLLSKGFSYDSVSFAINKFKGTDDDY